MSLACKDPEVRSKATAAGAGTGAKGMGAPTAGTGITGGIAAMLFCLFGSGYR